MQFQFKVRCWGVLPLIIAIFAVSPLQAQFNPVPDPIDVPGKVISDWIVTGDQDEFGNANPHMTRAWVGDGNNSNDFDYSIALASMGLPAAPDVDALGNIGDLFFNQLRNDVATLLVSPEFENNPAGGLNEIYFRTATPFGAFSGVWETNGPADIGGAPPAGENTPPEGIDGLEVWGGQDTNMFSLYTDPFDPGGLGQVSVFLYDPVNDTASPYILNDDIRNAIGLVPGDPGIDLDAMMVNDVLADGIFGPGDSLIFSVAANGLFHGGEIWTWDFGNPANFLFHGGVLWDTANSPMALFGWQSNEINALEAILVIPEPTSAAWMAIVLAAFLLTARRHVTRLRAPAGQIV